MATEMYCANCGSIAKPKKVTKGYFLIELFLWFLFILPGVLYSVWRLSTREKLCPRCSAPNMIPTDSPRAQAALKPAGGGST
jgi:ribosomal protein S27AE